MCIVHPLRALLGEGLGSCSLEELQQIEQQLEKSVNTVRAKKVSLTNLQIFLLLNSNILILMCI